MKIDMFDIKNLTKPNLAPAKEAKNGTKNKIAVSSYDILKEA